MIRLLRPRCFLLSNVPGLCDKKNWRVVQRTIGSLGPAWCADFAMLDAANYGVPQHRLRPFWFGHPAGWPCITWPTPTHGCPVLAAEPTLPGMPRMLPFVTCADALGHLSLEELGREVRLTKDGVDRTHSAASAARAITTQSRCHGVRPAPTMGGKNRGQQGASALRLHPRKIREDRRQNDGAHPARSITGRDSRDETLLQWPWNRPATTVQADPRLAPPGHHGESFMSDERGVLLSEKAAAIIQDFPPSWVFCGKTKKARWSQIGMAMPPGLACAVGSAVVEAYPSLRNL